MRYAREDRSIVSCVALHFPEEKNLFGIGNLVKNHWIGVAQREARGRNMLGSIGAAWGLVGIFLLLGSAVYRLTPVAMEAFDFHWEVWHWVVFLGNLIFMGVSEGYYGFHKKFAPRVAARARFLKAQGSIRLTVLAPFFCMGYFHAVGRVKLVAYLLTIGIVVLIVLVHRTHQPWRGIIDFGVVAGLALGTLSLAYFSLLAMGSDDFPFSPEVPDRDPRRVLGRELLRK